MKTFIGVFIFLLAQYAFSAQEMIVSSREAKIHSAPSSKSKILESKPKGERLIVSSTHKNGWYKIRTSAGIFGWVHQSFLISGNTVAVHPELDLEPMEVKHSEREAYVSPAEEKRSAPHGPQMLARAGAGVYTMTSSDLSIFLDQNKYHLYPTFLSQLHFGYRLTNWGLRLGVRAMAYTGTRRLKAFSTEYEIRHSGYPLLAGLSMDVLETENWIIEPFISVGMTIFNKTRVTIDPSGTPKDFALFTLVSPAFFLACALKYKLLKNFHLVLEPGFYYTYTAPVEIDNDVGGPVALRDSQGNLKTFSLTNWGPTFTLSAEFTF